MFVISLKDLENLLVIDLILLVFLNIVAVIILVNFRLNLFFEFEIVILIWFCLIMLFRIVVLGFVMLFNFVFWGLILIDVLFFFGVVLILGLFMSLMIFVNLVKLL